MGRRPRRKSPRRQRFVRPDLYNPGSNGFAPAKSVQSSPSVLRRALSLYRRHFGALVITGALAIAPASLLEGGALHAVDPPHRNQGGAPAPKTALPQGDAARLQQFGASKTDAVRPGEALRAALPILYQTFFGVLLLAAGAWLAFAALSTAVFTDDFSTARAWASAFSRLGPLFWTILLSGAAIAVGSLCFLIPGAILAVGLAFSVPVVMEERLSGGAALHRSWQLVSCIWPRVLGLLLLLAVFSAAASGISMLTPPGPLRLLIATAIRTICWPLPLAGLALSYKAACQQV
jgi:hypothetical protein